ncbi:MAG: hypothetical protein AB2693_31240, partial [Candidatus Thiodiazotropha sp.]
MKPREIFFATDFVGPIKEMADAVALAAQGSIDVHCVMDNMRVPYANDSPTKLNRVNSIQQIQIDSPSTHLKLPTPINVRVLAQYLDGYDVQKKEFVLKVFSEGFSLGVVGTVPPSISPNHSSAVAHSQFVDEKIKQELKLNRIKGPYTAPPFERFKVSPLGVIPKKEPNAFRLIQDLSFGTPGTAVNHFIPPENSTVTLETFDDVANLVLACGKNALIAKADVAESYRMA